MEIKNNCPNCKHDISGNTQAMESGRTPLSGDITICVYCHSLLRFTDTLGLRVITESEMLSIQNTNPEIYARLLYVRDMMQKFGPVAKLKTSPLNNLSVKN